MAAFGPRDYLFEMAKILSNKGYSVLLPKFYYCIRKAPVIPVSFPVSAAEMPEVLKQIMPLFQNFIAEEFLPEADAFLYFLLQKKEVRTGPIAITGYCLAGALALIVAARYLARINAAASFHAGRLATDAEDSPYKLLAKIIFSF